MPTNKIANPDAAGKSSPERWPSPLLRRARLCIRDRGRHYTKAAILYLLAQVADKLAQWETVEALNAGLDSNERGR